MIGGRLAQQAEGRGTADEVEVVVILDTTTRNIPGGTIVTGKPIEPGNKERRFVLVAKG
jgi:hypothetical protein